MDADDPHDADADTGPTADVTADANTDATSDAGGPGGPPAIILLDAQGRIRSLDPAAERLFGCAGADLAGNAFESLLATPPSPALVWGADEGTAGTTGTPGWQRSAARCRGRRDATPFLVDISIARMATPAEGFAAFVRDLGREPALQLELQSVERQLRMLIELAPIAIWVATDDQVILANRAAGELLGLDSGSALVGKSVYTLLNAGDHEELRLHLAQACRHEGQIGTMQARLHGAQADDCEVEIALAALPDHGRTTVQMVVSNVSQRNGELREIQRSRQLLKRLSANVVEAREEERRRIARELHDELGQGLSALKMDIAHCAQSHGVPADGERVAGLLAALDGVMGSVRRIASDLRPLMLDDLGLGDALESLARDFSRRQGIQVRLHVDRLEPPPDEKVSIALYRMVQEALMNVARHARAREVRIELRRAADGLTLRVQDDGVGLPSPPPPQRDSQFGLLGMQERADALGGRMELDTQHDGGACIVVHLPVRARRPAAKAAAAVQRPPSH